MRTFLNGAVVVLVAMFLVTGCKKEKAFILNFDSLPDYGIAPGFVVKHSALQKANQEFFICGTTRDSNIFLAYLDSLGEPAAIRKNFGPGSAHDLIPLGEADSLGFLMLINQDNQFYSVILDSLGREQGRHDYREAFEQKGLFKSAQAYAVSRTSKGGFIFTGRYRQTIGDPAIFVLRVDSNHQTLPLTTLRSNHVGTSITETADGHFVLSGIEQKNRHVYLAVLNSEGVLQTERNLFETREHFSNEVLHQGGNQFVLTGTREEGATTNLMFLQCSFDGGGISIDRELSIGEPSVSEYGYRLTTTRDGGYVILGIVEREQEMGLLFQKINSNISEGWQEYYPGGIREYPGDLLQHQEDYGFLGFGVVEQGTESRIHLVKTDEVGMIEN